MEDGKYEREDRSREAANLATAVHSLALVAYTIEQPHTACSNDSKEGFCADAEWTCRPLKVARICGTPVRQVGTVDVTGSSLDSIPFWTSQFPAVLFGPTRDPRY